MAWSCDQLCDNGAAELVKLLEPTGVVVGELVVEAEQSQKGDVKIADFGFAFDGSHAEFVRGTNRVTGVATATSKPNGYGVGIVVSA